MNFNHQLFFSKVANLIFENINSFDDLKYYKKSESSNIWFTIFNTKTMLKFKLNGKFLNLNNKTYKFIDICRYNYSYNYSILPNIKKS